MVGVMVAGSGGLGQACIGLSTVQAKMQEYLDNGARLGWLIDAAMRAIYVYRPNQPVERLDNPIAISGEPILPASPAPVTK
jgi:Uma2 family endonuclease